MIKWNKSSEGFVESKCGDFSIYPLYFGCVNPQCYELRDNRTKNRYSQIDTQSDAKSKAESLIFSAGCRVGRVMQ